MLALQTGWTPDTLAEIPDRFRRACHWAIYARAIAGTNGLAEVVVPSHAPVEQRLAAMKERVALNTLRSAIYPDDV